MSPLPVNILLWSTRLSLAKSESVGIDNNSLLIFEISLIATSININIDFALIFSIILYLIGDCGFFKSSGTGFNKILKL